MTSYDVTITARVQWTTTVEANNPDEAADQAREMEPDDDLLPYDFEITEVSPT